MRWLPNRRRQHWALRLFQIGQATLLTGVLLIITIGGPIVITDRICWLWFMFAMFAWISLLARCGWAISLMIAGVVFAFLTPVINSHGDAEAIVLRRLIASGVVGLAIGGILDAIGLATTADVDYSNPRSLAADAPNTVAESNESTPTV